jgi:apolipoprotein D and lipocalin family protein
MRILPVIAAVTAAFLVVACSSPTPPGVTVVNNFDAQRFLGTWYEIARFDHRFERGLEKVTANYSSMDDGGIQVINRGYNPIGRCGSSRLDKRTLPATRTGRA